MSAHTFDRRRLEQRLERLEWAEQIAFAALCAERLLPYYGSFSAIERWGNYELLQEGIEAAWRAVRGAPLPRREYEHLLDEITKATPDTQDFAGHLVSGALDAAVAVAGTIAICIEPNVREAADVGQAAFDAAFGAAQADQHLGHGMIQVADRDQLRRLVKAPPVQRELEVQANSLTELSSRQRPVDVKGLRSRYGSTSAWGSK